MCKFSQLFFNHVNVDVGKRLHIYIFYQGSAAVAISSYNNKVQEHTKESIVMRKLIGRTCI